MIEFKNGSFVPRQDLKPYITNNMARSVSQYRRAALEEELNKGLFSEKGATKSTDINSNSYLSGISTGFSKKASNYDSSSVGGAGANWRGSGGVLHQVSEVYSPLWLYSNLSLPRDRATINAWSRAFFALNPFVHNACTLHSTYPVAKLSIKCKNPKVEKFFAEMIEEINLMDMIVQIAQEYWILGEAIVYAELDKDKGKWSRLIIQNPDYVVIQNSLGGDPVISLRPDELLKKIVNGNSPAEVMQRSKLDPAIVDRVRKGENIPLDNFNCSHLARRISPYEVRGTGLIVPAFKALMLFDQFREAKYTQAVSMVNPLTLVKIGSAEFKPSPEDIASYRDIWEAAEADRNFKIFTHQDVAVEKIGSNSGILDDSGVVTQLVKEIFTALMVPSVIMDGGSDTTYANGSVGLDVLRQRYMQFRNMLTNWLRRKIFAPISIINDFYDYENEEKKLIVPEIDWNHMSMFDMGDYIQNLMNMTQDPNTKKASYQTLYRSLGLDYEDEQRRIRQEAISDAILAKEKVSLEKMSLNELRALGPSDEIPEVPENPLPGEDPTTGGGGAAPGGEPPPGELPGVPPPPAPPEAPPG
jgi:hypothetical protein